MCKRNLIIFLSVAFFLMPGHAWATRPACPANPVYISSGSRILCVDRAPATLPAQVVVLTTERSAVFEDLAFGPDGNIYAADSLGATVWRVDPSTGSHVQVAISPSGSGAPTGLSFSGSDGDLYVNTTTGVWKVTGIASAFSPPSLPVTLTISDNRVITFTSSIAAGGNAFDIPGDLVLVDQTNSQVLISTPNPFPTTPRYSSASPLTSVSNAGPGIAVNFCGDLLVASGNAVKRFRNGTLSIYKSLGSSNDLVRYLEVTADNTVLAATFSTSTGGKVWRIDPVVDSTGVPSCTATPAATLLVSLNPSTIANGVALPPTSIKVTHTFGAADGPCPSTTGVDQSLNKRVYNFGHHSFSVTYEQLRKCFTQSFTAVRSRPADISFSSTFQSGTVPMHYASLGGFAVDYVTPDPAPDSTNDYVSTGDGHAIEIRVGYDTIDIVFDPGLGHATGDVLLTSPAAAITYTNDFTSNFWPAAGPGLDPGTGSSSDGWGSTFVVFNAPLKVTGTITIKQPPLSNNPQFNVGQTIRVAFNLTDPSGAAIPNAIMRLSILRTSPSLNTEAVVSTNNVNVDNIFKTGSGNLYTFPVDSSAFAPRPPGTTAIYQFTIFGDSAVPFAFNVTVLF